MLKKEKRLTFLKTYFLEGFKDNNENSREGSLLWGHKLNF